MNGDCCYMLRGDLYLLDYDKSHEGYGDCYGYNYGGGNDQSYVGVMAGNATVTVNLQQNELVKVSRDGLGMTGCAYPDLTGSIIEVSLKCASQRNLNLALRGVSAETTTTAGAVTSEVYPAPCNEGFQESSFTRFNNPADVATVVLVRDDTMAVLVEGVDYTVTSIGFTMLVGLPPFVNIEATYTALAMTISSIEAFLVQPKLFKMTIIGKNVVSDSDQTYIYTFRKVRLSALTNQFEVLNEDFPDLNLNGFLLRDRLASSNQSPFMTVEKIS